MYNVPWRAPRAAPKQGNYRNAPGAKPFQSHTLYACHSCGLHNDTILPVKGHVRYGSHVTLNDPVA